MGNELGGYEATGGGEAVGLAKLCESFMRFPAIDPKVGDGQLTKQLKSWIVGRKTEANRDKTVAGAKYPHLCRFAEHLYETLGNSLRIIIAVDVRLSGWILRNKIQLQESLVFESGNEIDSFGKALKITNRMHGEPIATNLSCLVEPQPKCLAWQSFRQYQSLRSLASFAHSNFQQFLR